MDRMYAVARPSYVQMRNRPESKLGTTVLDGSVVEAYAVDAFHVDARGKAPSGNEVANGLVASAQLMAEQHRLGWPE
ncbi:hypothetical protein [Myxococcus sp. Y35]|uniref:hypothetical protein n=1 Tax=Pseudomyxococcus flavus TaxID=3115648 RepID=UPI003CE9F40A